MKTPYKRFCIIFFSFILGISMLIPSYSFAEGENNKDSNKNKTKMQKNRTEASPKDVLIFPNPTRGKLNIVFTETPNTPPAFTVFNILGNDLRNIEVTQISQREFEINLSDKDAGLYFIRIQTATFTITERITLDFKVNYTIS